MSYSGVYIDDGLKEKSKARFKKRRTKLMRAFKHPILITGSISEPGGKSPWSNIHVPIYQEPLFLYLTGINQRHVALLLDPEHPTEKEVLFIEEKDPHYEFWEGSRFGIGDMQSYKDIQDITGIQTIYDIDDMMQHLSERIHTAQDTAQDTAQNTIKELGLYWHQSEKSRKLIKDDTYTFKNKVKNQLKKNNLSHINIVNISKTQWKHRLILDDIDQQNLRIANKKTTAAFTHVLSTLKYCKTETDVMGYLEGHITRHSWFKESFPSIVASGKNATVLHYTQNNAPLAKNSLLLLDFGVRWQSMHADVSRTIPVNGKFNPLQALLYNIVLQAQKKVEDAVKPGVTIHKLNQICWDYINQACVEHILNKGGNMIRPYDHAPHNVSHFLGLEVHDGDPFRNYRKDKLKAGQVISNEPGFYGEVTLKIDGKTYHEHLGIRIEDDLLVTKDGCENLTKGCPKSIKMLEAFIK